MESRLLREYKGKSIIDIEEGRRIGAFEDLLISPGDFRTLAIITTKAMLFNRRAEALRAEDVRVWGRDVILAAGPSVIHPREEIPGLEDALLASTVLRGRSAISMDGRRLGVVDDFYIDRDGRIEAVHLSQTIADGPISRLKLLPITALRSLGPDVIIVDMDRMVFVEHPAAPAGASAQTFDAGSAAPMSTAVDETSMPPLAAAPEGSLYGVDTSMLPTLPTRPEEIHQEGALIFDAERR